MTGDHPLPKPSQALPALVNVFLPGVGQLIQGRVLAWIFWWVVLFVSVTAISVGIGLITTPILWLICIIEAAKHNPHVRQPGIYGRGGTVVLVLIGIVILAATLIYVADFLRGPLIG